MRRTNSGSYAETAARRGSGNARLNGNVDKVNGVKIATRFRSEDARTRENADRSKGGAVASARQENAGTGRRLAKNAAWFIVLALCFVIVFGVTLVIGNSNAVDVASANMQQVTSGTNLVQGDHALTAESFNFPGNIGTIGWSDSLDFSGTYFNKNNVSVVGDIQKNFGQSQKYGQFVEGTGTFQLNTDGAPYWGTSNLYGLFNVDMGFIDTFFKTSDYADHFDITAEVSAYISAKSMNSAGIRAYVTSGTAVANRSTYDTIKGGSWNGVGKASGDTVNTGGASQTVTLTKAAHNLSVIFSWTTNNNTNAVATSISDITIEFTITPKDGFGGAPIGLENFSASPYRTNINADFPVTNTNVINQYRNYFDSENNMKDGWNLRSFAGKSLGTKGGYNYYKTASFQVTDKYAEAKHVLKDPSGQDVESNWIPITKSIPKTDSDGYFLDADGNRTSDPTKYVWETVQKTDSKGNKLWDMYTTYNNGDDGANPYTGGLKGVYINDVFVSSAAGNSVLFKESDSASAPYVGYIEFAKSNNYRWNVTIYFFTNTTFTFKVDRNIEYDMSTLEKTFDVTGIDPTKPESLTALKGDNILTDNLAEIGGLYWFNHVTFSGDLNPYNEIEDEYLGYTPYIWYYNVKWSADGTFTNDYPVYGFSDLNANTAVPFMISTMPSFSSFNMAYNFDSGTMFGVAPMGVGADEKITGPGYYRFVFYTMDFAGNVGEPSVYYVRTDYITPENELEARFGRSDDTVINPAHDAAIRPNGTWATDTLRLTFKFTNGENYSGNTLSFTVTDGENDIAYRILLKDGKIVAIIRDGVRLNVQLEDNDKATAQPVDDMMFRYEASGTPGASSASATFTIDFSSTDANSFATNYKEFDFRSSFVLSTGHLTEDDTEYMLSATDARWTYVVDNKTQNLVCVRVDKNKPDAIEIADANGDGYFKTVTKESNFKEYPVFNRKWYTDNWSIGSTVAFNDNLLQSYSKNIKLYIGMSFMSPASFNNNLFTDKINEIFAGGDLSSLESYFTSLTVIGGDRIANSQTVGGITQNIDLNSNDDAGLRIFYAWAVDQAGNIGELKIYEILVDANQYTIKVNADNSYFQKSGVEAIQSNSETSSNDTLKYRRGDVMQLQMNMQGYIPYALTAYDANSQFMGELFHNDTTKSTLEKVAGSKYEDFIKATALQTGNVDAEIKIDGSLLTRFPGSQLVLTYRQKVTFGIANNSVPYSGEATQVPISIDQTAALSELIYTFFQENVDKEHQDGVEDDANTAVDTNKIDTPVNVGSYKVKIKLNPDSKNYVAEERGLTPYYIIPREMTVKAKNTQSTYGQAIIDEGCLKFEISGLSEADAAKLAAGTLTIPGSLKLKDKGVNDYDNLKALNVGAYYVVQNVPFELENYNVTFVGAQHTVAPRTIQVTVNSGQRKTFGEGDGNIQFNIPIDALVNNDAVSKVFGTDGISEVSRTEQVITLQGKDVILREPGEYAGFYPYITTGSRIIVHSNYKVEINVAENDPGFEIVTRNVQITVPSQTIAASAEQMSEANVADFIAGIRVNYVLGLDADAQYLQFLQGKLTLSDMQKDDADSTYTVYTFKVGIGTMAGVTVNGKGSINPVFPDGSNYTFTVKVDKTGNTVVVKMKPNEGGGRILVQKTYGENWNSSSEGQFSKDLFDVSGVKENYGENWTIKWDAVLNRTGSGTIPRGVYSITAERAAFYDTSSGSPVLVEGVTVLVEKFSVEFLPVKVYVRPVVVASRWIPASAGVEAHGFRYYGESDSVYGLDWEIVNADELSAKGFNVENIKENTLGNFVRGKYVKNAKGEYVLAENGLHYDDAYTGGDADVIYAATVGEFFNGGTNFSVSVYTQEKLDANGNVVTDSAGNSVMQTEADALTSACRLYVLPKTINVSGDDLSNPVAQGDFYGASKNFDGTTNFINPGDGWNFLDLKTFAVGTANPQPVLVRVSDDVIFVCDARYDSSEVGTRYLILSNPRLEDSHGNAVTNYVLNISNLTAEGEIIVLHESYGVRVKINKVTSFSVTKNNFTVSKQYDGSANVLKNDIAVSGALSALPMVIESVSMLPQANVSSNLSVKRLVMFFEVPNIGDDNWVFDSETPHDDVTVEILKNIIADGRVTSGIRVTVTDMPAAIVKRAITPDSFDEFYVVDRQYDGTNKVQIYTKFTSGKLVPGDTDESVGLVFDATAADKNAGAIVKGKISRTAVTINGYSVKNSNYSVDLKDFEDYGGTTFADKNYLDAEISRVKLSPDFLKQFTLGKQYNGSGALVKGTDFNAEGSFIEETMTDELKAELRHLTYNISNSNFALFYSDNSLRNKADADKKNANVAFDENGNVILHDIMANSFEIIFTPTVGADAAAVTATKDILKNYVFADADGTAPEFNGENNSAVLAAIYFDNAAPLEQKVISAILDNVTVADKVYDGTRKADVSIALAGIAECDKDKVALTIAGEFKNADAGENKGVVVKSDTFKGVLGANGETVPENETAARNYKLSNRINATLTAKISPAPLTLAMGLGEKTYDGTPYVNADNIPESARKLDGFRPGDDSKYQVSVSKASFTDKNVVRETPAKEGEIGAVTGKDGMAYGLSLVNVYNRDVINYYIRFKSVTELTDAEANGYVADGKETDADGNVTGYYYKPGEAAYVVLSSTYDSAANAEATYGKKIGYYNYSKDNTYYLVYNSSDISSVSNVHKIAPVNYVPATGKINPKRVSISASKPDNYNGTAYVKDYDSSRTFHGSFGTDFVIDTNFGGILDADRNGITVGDDAYTAEFDDTQAGGRYVRIAIDAAKLTGEAVGNYDFSSSVSEIPARINKIEMIASLGDDEITYGEPKDSYNNVTFILQKRDTNGNLVSEGDDVFTELKAIYSGEFAGLFIPKDRLLTVYPHGKAGDTYTIDDNGNVTKHTDDSGDYLRLFGSYDLPEGVKTVNSLTGVGTYAYTLTVGSSTNYVFKAQYSTPDVECGENTHSVITVKKAPLYVYAKGSYSLIYGNSLPTINLGFAGSADKSTSGFKNGDGIQSVFGSNNLIKACFKMYDGTTFTGDALTNSFTVPTGDSSVGVFIDISAYTDGTAAGLANYELFLADGVSALEITLPEIPNIRIMGSEANPEETEYTGYDLKNHVFGGLLENDVVSYKLYKWAAKTVNNAEVYDWEEMTATDIIGIGKYKISITVNRAIPNDAGNNSYKQFAATSYLTVEPASLKMTADKETITIDFAAHTFDLNNIKFNSAIKADVLPSLDKIEVHYQWINGSVVTDNVTEMLHAGRYAITLRYTGADSNFKANQTATVYYVIDPMKIDVTVNPDDTVILFKDAESAKLAFTFALSKDYDNLSEEVRNNLLEHMPELVARYIDNGYVTITGAGRYQYVIEPTGDVTASDFSLIGNSSGSLSVVVDTVTTTIGTNGNYNASLNLGDGAGVIAEKLTYKQIYENNLASASDDAYWRRIASYMPMIGSKDVPASLAAVVKIAMTYNNQTVNLTEGKTATLRVALPEGVSSLKNMAVYRVNREGGLTKVDYQLDNGYIVYDTDFIAPLVFVKLGAEFPIWAIVLISLGAAIAVAGIVVGVVLGVKKNKRA